MARRFRRRGHRRGLPKTVGGWVSLAFKGIGAVAAAAPAIQQGIQYLPSGDFGSFANGTVYAYTGFNPKDGSFTIGQTAVGVGSILGGVVIAKIGSIFGKMIH